jgi:hypothetical protein
MCKSHRVVVSYNGGGIHEEAHVEDFVSSITWAVLVDGGADD